jgi:hypothetical protein
MESNYWISIIELLATQDPRALGCLYICFPPTPKYIQAIITDVLLNRPINDVNNISDVGFVEIVAPVKCPTTKFLGVINLLREQASQACSPKVHMPLPNPGRVLQENLE